MSEEEINKLLLHHHTLKNDAGHAQQDMNTFKEKVGAHIVELALKNFSALNEMESHEIRKFGNIISEHTRKLAEEMNKLNFGAKKKFNG